MKITIQLPVEPNQGGVEIEWDSSMCDDRVEVNQIARDISKGKTPMDVLDGYVRRHAALMAYVCPVCIANGLEDKPEPEAEGQAGLF
jgi:hypothetical protein